MKRTSTKRKASRKTQGKNAARQSRNAIDMLTEDHEMVQKLFQQYRRLMKSNGSDREKGDIVRKACDALTVHAMIEEEIVYPMARNLLDEQEIMDEAEVEHQGAKDLIAQLENMEPGDDLYDAKFIVLGEQVKHHIQEEEGKMFPKLKKAKVDLEQLGMEISRYKMDLEEDMEDGYMDEGRMSRNLSSRRDSGYTGYGRYSRN